MFRIQKQLAVVIKRPFASRKSFTGRYRVAKDEKYEGLKNKPVYGKAMRTGVEKDPDLESHDYIELENDGNKVYNAESEKVKEKRLQEFLNSKTSIEDKLQSYMESAKDNQEIVFKSEKFMEAYRRRDLGSLFADDNQDILDQYNRYDYYRKNYVDKTDNSEMKLKDESKLYRDEMNHNIDGVNEFLNDLDPKLTKHMSSEYVAKNVEALNMLKSLEEKVELLDQSRPIRVLERMNKEASVAELTDLQKKLVEEFGDHADKTKNNLTGPQFEKKFVKMIDQSAVDDPIDQIEYEIEKPILQLSLRSKLEAYRLYLEGWNIKDICMRFGISPQRAKIIIWNFQYYIEDVLPFQTPEQVIEDLYMEIFPHDDEVEIVDYGIDLEILHKFQAGHEVKVFKKQYMDHLPKTNKEAGMTDKEIEERVNKTKSKREDFVIEKIVSTGSPPYYLKNWLIYRGRGMMRVNRMFKKIVERSYYQGHLPYDVNKKLEKGPRIASLGYGVK